MSHATSLLTLKPDGRTTEARVAREFRAELLAKLHVAPNEIQTLVLDEAVRLRLALLRDGGCETLDRLIKMQALLGITVPADVEAG